MGMADPAPGKLEANLADIIGLGHLNTDDEPVFILTKEQDFGSAATAVATKITDSAPCKGEVLGALFILTEAKAGGSGDDVTCIAKDSGAATKMTADVTLDMSDTVFMNHLGSVVGVAPHGTEANRQFAKGGDIYVYTDAQTSRSAGKYHTILICKKIA
jgi:hypothetical protein